MIAVPSTSTASSGPRRLNRVVIVCAIVASLGGLLFGFDTAVISGATSALVTKFSLTDTTKGFTVAIAIIGTAFGAMLAGIPGERYGARECLKVLGLLFMVSSIGCGLAWDWYSFLVFRFIGGLAIGGSSVLGPIYIAEVAPAAWRGRLVGCFQVNVVGGILVAYLSNYLIGLLALGDIEWRVKLGVGGIPAVLFFVLLYGIPRSPRWLAKKQKLDEAREVLVKIGEEQVDEELQTIVTSLDAAHGHADEPLFSRKYAQPIFLAVAIAFFNQLTGINALLYYLNDIFGAAGFSKVSGDLQAVAVGTNNFIFTLVGMSLIDKVGRRVLLLVGSVGMAVALSGVAAIFYTQQHQAWLVGMLVLYGVFFASSQGAVIWVYISEVFPNRVRAKGQSLGSFTHWAMCGIVSFSFPVLSHATGRAVPFVFFAAMMVVQFFVVFFTFPETKGITLEAMQEKFGIE